MRLSLICLWAGVLARGDAAINMRFPKPGYREKIWDHAAGALIVQEAGAVISDASGALPTRLAGCSWRGTKYVFLMMPGGRFPADRMPAG